MIYTVTLNPSIDYTLRLDRLTPGAVNRTTGEETGLGGKGLNVSLVLAELGVESTALGFIAGFTGDAVADGLRERGIPADLIRLRGGLSRINVQIHAGEETEINGQGPRVEQDELEAILARLDRLDPGDTLILSGSVPPGLPQDVYRQMMDRVRDREIPIVLDTSGPLLLEALSGRPFLIKPNRQELSDLFSEQVNTPADAALYARRLRELGARNVLVSLGGKGAVLVEESGRVHRMPALPGKAVHTVGAGDSMVAGFVAGYARTRDYAYALRLGTACGGATAFSSGLARRERIEELLALAPAPEAL